MQQTDNSISFSLDISVLFSCFECNNKTDYIIGKADLPKGCGDNNQGIPFASQAHTRLRCDK